MKKQTYASPTNEQLIEFVGDVEYLDRISCKRVYNNYFRVDVHTKYYQEGRVVPTMSIPYSYFVQYLDGQIIDKTLKPRSYE